MKKSYCSLTSVTSLSNYDKSNLLKNHPYQYNVHRCPVKNTIFNAKMKQILVMRVTCTLGRKDTKEENSHSKSAKTAKIILKRTFNIFYNKTFARYDFILINRLQLAKYHLVSIIH